MICFTPSRGLEISGKATGVLGGSPKRSEKNLYETPLQTYGAPVYEIAKLVNICEHNSRWTNLGWREI